jgi:hypothetical protein
VRSDCEAKALDMGSPWGGRRKTAAGVILLYVTYYE